MNIINGYRGEPHITSQQARNINRGLFGNGVYVPHVGNRLAVTVPSVNTIKIADGLLIVEGCAAEIPAGTTEALTIANGTQGMRRIDIIVARYRKETATSKESMELAVVTGTPAASNPQPPTIQSGTISSGVPLVEYPVFMVSVSNLAAPVVTPLYKEAESVFELAEDIADVVGDVGNFTALLAGKTSAYTWSTDDELIAAIPNMRSKELFMYYGTGRFSQDVLVTDAAHECFGIGWKPADNAVFLLSVCYGKLYYTVQRTDGTGESYWPLNLNTYAR